VDCRIKVVVVNDNPDGEYYQTHHIKLSGDSLESIKNQIETIMVFGLNIPYNNDEVKLIPEHCIRSIIIPAEINFAWDVWEELA